MDGKEAIEKGNSVITAETYKAAGNVLEMVDKNESRNFYRKEYFKELFTCDIGNVNGAAEELEEVIVKMKMNKTAGMANINGKLLKHMGPDMLRGLDRLIERI